MPRKPRLSDEQLNALLNDFRFDDEQLIKLLNAHLPGVEDRKWFLVYLIFPDAMKVTDSEGACALVEGLIAFAHDIAAGGVDAPAQNVAAQMGAAKVLLDEFMPNLQPITMGPKGEVIREGGFASEAQRQKLIGQHGELAPPPIPDPMWTDAFAAFQLSAEDAEFMRRVFDLAHEHRKQRERAKARGKQKTDEGARTRELVRRVQARLRKELAREPSIKRLVSECRQENEDSAEMGERTVKRYRLPKKKKS